MLWLENTASTERSATADMSVMVPTTSGSTAGSMSSRTSCHAASRKPRVVWSLRFCPHPTWRRIDIEGLDWKPRTVVAYRPRRFKRWSAGTADPFDLPVQGDAELLLHV